jgi:hypothetical protein
MDEIRNRASSAQLLWPLEHLAATFKAGCVDLMGIDVRKYVADWAATGHTLEETLEVTRIHKGTTVAFAARMHEESSEPECVPCLLQFSFSVAWRRNVSKLHAAWPLDVHLSVFIQALATLYM